jgi:hypothetical protein
LYRKIKEFIMRYDRFTIKAQEALGEADAAVHTYNHSVLDTEHLLYALIEQDEGSSRPSSTGSGWTEGGSLRSLRMS